jgi:hypothetical protein
VIPPVNPAAVPPAPECIRLRGVRQNNLKGFDLDVPLGRYIVVTGLSGAGKSSLVFDTLHAEGQRRYVETFSAYTRQFLDLLDKPKVDSIENIRPSIAIEQTNTVKTSRSTVGTMTELTDFGKVWFSHVARCYDPATGEPVEDDTPLDLAKTAGCPRGRQRRRRLSRRQTRQPHLARDPRQPEGPVLRPRPAPGGGGPRRGRTASTTCWPSRSPLSGADAIDVAQDRHRRRRSKPRDVSRSGRRPPSISARAR